MEKVRKLQYISGQFMLNIPKRMAEISDWRMGDYFKIVQKDKNTFEIQKIADGSLPKDAALLPLTENEAANTFNALYYGGKNMDMITFPILLSKLTKSLAMMRKQKKRLQYLSAGKAASPAQD